MIKNALLLFLSISFLSCAPKIEINIPQYYELIRQAEANICQEAYAEAGEMYVQAFSKIDKPFGKDVFNAALAAAVNQDSLQVINYLQQIINNSDDLAYVKEVFVDQYIAQNAWDQMLSQRLVDYNIDLRQECKEIHDRDQLFRPNYDVYDDTINANRVLNLNRILELSKEIGLPAHQELGYTEKLRGQKHHIVLLHTAQRRSRDKSIKDVEPLLKEAVEQGRFDPEKAIYYMNSQNDPEKGTFEVFATAQFRHPLLSDSLQQLVWIPRLSQEQEEAANATRAAWHANSLAEISEKALFLNKPDALPFIFSSVRKSISNFPLDMDLETALLQYQYFTEQMMLYQGDR